MYQLLKSPTHDLPVLVSTLNPILLDYIMCGYEKISSGTRKQMEIELSEYMEMYCEGMLIELN